MEQEGRRMTADDLKLLLTTIGKINSALPEKIYTRKEVKEITLQIVKEMEKLK